MIRFDILEKIREAHRLAEIEQIKANAIVINKNFVKTPKLIVNGGGAVSVLPPMICGLEMYFTDNELPENYSFAILEAAQTERERLVDDTRWQTVKEIYGEIDDSDILTVDTQDYGEIDVVPIERLKEIIKSKGVEVE